MDALWDTSCITASTNDVKHMTSLGLESNINNAATERVFYYHRGIKNKDIDAPILVLIHGYPQTSFMLVPPLSQFIMRALSLISSLQVIPRLPSHIPLFIPDVPGYGRSSPLSGSHDKRSTGKAILQSLHFLMNSTEKQTIVIAGHDRGARICHRLAVDQASVPHFSIRGAIFIDIVPTSVQWKSFGTAAGSVGSFHWPFLANVEVATHMIGAQGGGVFVQTCLNRWVGKSDIGSFSFKEHDAVKVYSDSFKYESVIRASCDDYRAGAEEDIQLQDEDQKEGRKVDIDVLVLYSADYLGKRYDLQEVWQKWMGKGKLEVEGFGDGVGHFIAEEAPEKIASAIQSFYNQHA
ncbi:Fluoroacetate dehalogenase [Lachnellula suecica]|uniref:Fluoroacetate dehalogenase n=1 Tax=Lachnellula suecica TaxID=602035 RepID=A0A8T9C840_9HELO|nr:Fluoroacetate dehalogenase [Lachnellula suecica]